jgi:thymidylate synthase ThyX
MTPWQRVANAANCTVDATNSRKDPSASWKKRILLAEHSPIRALIQEIFISKIPYWVSVHITRHKIGVEHFVSTQRSDRTGLARDALPQNAPVNHLIIANAQALINISRKRLCNSASPETRSAWQKAVSLIDDEILRSVCVPECIYRGFCPEMKKCGYNKTADYQKKLEEYRS